MDRSLIIDVVKKTTSNLFSTMLKMEITADDALEGQNTLPLQAHVTAVIGCAGNYRGGMAIYLPKDLALESVAAMLDIDVEKITIDQMTLNVKDAIGEIINIIAGGVKAELYKAGVTFKLSLPTVIVGEKFRVYVDSSQERARAIVPFSSKGKQFFVECNIEKAEKRVNE
ncbi:MAG: chemotaxis protein CheX [Candidatus Omnitrophica bacterium]|nr:chemotaxis protein CheX [Candidatus Omnitrophota bacterium]